LASGLADPKRSSVDKRGIVAAPAAPAVPELEALHFLPAFADSPSFRGGLGSFLSDIAFNIFVISRANVKSAGPRSNISRISSNPAFFTATTFLATNQVTHPSVSNIMM
jgi:hypothetical protein